MWGVVCTCSAAEQPLCLSAVSMSFCFSSCKAGIWGPLLRAGRENEGIPLFIPEPGICPSRTLTAQAPLCSCYRFPGCLRFPGGCLCPFFCFPWTPDPGIFSKAGTSGPTLPVQIRPSSKYYLATSCIHPELTFTQVCSTCGGLIAPTSS